MTIRPSRALALAAAASVLLVATLPARGADNPYADAFVSEYRCAGDRVLAVSYPAPRHRVSIPVRIGFNGGTVALTRAAPGRGVRWTSRADDLVWTTQGRDATLTRGSDGTVLVAGCREQ